MVEWSLQHEPERFAGQDTLWNMDDTLTWLPPNGDVNEAHVETLGNMISEVFHQHENAVADKKRHDAKKEGKESSTTAEASQWGGVTCTVPISSRPRSNVFWVGFDPCRSM